MSTTAVATPLFPKPNQEMWACKRRFHTLPSFVLLLPFLRWWGDIWPSVSSLCAQDEVSNVGDDVGACASCSLVPTAHCRLERVITCTVLGQSVSPLIASSGKAPFVIQLGPLRFGQVGFALQHGIHLRLLSNVSNALPDLSPHISVRPSSSGAPLLSTCDAPKHGRAIGDEGSSRFRQGYGLQQGPKLCPHDAALHWMAPCAAHTSS